MKVNWKTLGFMIVLLMLVSFPAPGLFAEEATSETSDAASVTEREILSDKEAFRTQREQIKSNALASRQEEKALREQIQQAIRSGDRQTAESLKARLKAMHQENVQQRQQEGKNLKSARQEMLSDKKETRFDRMDKNNDGTVDPAEKRAFEKLKADSNRDGTIDPTERVQYERRRGKRDNDNNPPGAVGGPGTNWENPPGARGGAGASPDRGGSARRDNDNNPPGAVGGPGTNWENPPGAKGGPGASPDRGGRRR